MAMKEEDAAILLEHLRGIEGYGSNCPACRQNNWGMEGPVGVQLVKETPRGLNLENQGLPVVLLVCSNCAYLQSFAWFPLREKVLKARAAKAASGG